MPATTTIRVPGVPYELAFEESVHNRHWSTSRFANTQSAQVEILAAKAGELQPGGTASLTLRQSSLPGGGGRGLPSGYDFYVYSIQLVFGSGAGVRFNNAVPAAGSPTDGDMLQVFTRAVFSFKVQTKTRSSGPLYKYPGGSGLVITGTDVVNAANHSFSSNGRQSPRDQAAFLIPHHLEPNIPFVGTIDFDAALALSGTNTMDVEGHVEGIEGRPVV